MLKQCILILISSCLSLTHCFSQDSTHTKANDMSVPFYKWEIGIDALPLIGKAKDPFGYILKRNFQSASGRQALRLKLLPKLQYIPLPEGNQNSININLTIGYEWQKLYNQFAILYGFDPYIEYGQIKLTSDTKGIITKQTTLKLGASAFVGGRYYLGKHLALTLETHLFYQYYNFKAVDNSSGSSLAGAYLKTHQIYLNPVNALYLSYHF